MSELFRRMFAQPGFRLCVVLLLASGVLVGQEGRRPTLEGGVRQQERRPTTVKGGVRQQEELPDEFSLLKAAESQCRDAREALDLYHRAAADTKLVLSDDWTGVDERLYAGMASCIECPMAELKVYIELLRKLQIARPDPRARAELYRHVVSLESGNEPARGPVSLQAFDQAVQKWRQKIQETLKGAEGCFRESCTETLQAMRDALPPDRPSRGGVFGQDGGGRGARRSNGGLPPMPPPMPPTLSGGVEESGGTASGRGPASREVTPRTPGKTAPPSKSEDAATAAAGAAASAIAGAPPWKLKLAEGVTLSVTEEAIKKGAVQAVGRGAVTVAVGTGVAVLTEAAKDTGLAAATAGMVCVSGAAINQQIAQAKKFELHSWEHHKELQQADREWQAEEQRHLRQMDEMARRLQDEPRRHEEAQRRIEQQQRQMDQRHQQMMKSGDANARQVEQRRYDQDRNEIEKARMRERQENLRREKLYREEGPRQARDEHRRNVDRIIDKSAKTPQQREQMRREADQIDRFVEQKGVRPPPRAQPDINKGMEARRQLRLENFRREWDVQWARYQGYLDGLQMEWNFEMDRHNNNPFKTVAEAERHAAELARLNAKARCLMGDQLAALDALRLKYQLW
jgi:hypothetical protein